MHFSIRFTQPAIKTAARAIEEIRDIYRKTFAQESVLRIDGESCVSF
jgi:hypothetical protein